MSIPDNPAIPARGQSIIIGVIGISQQWSYFDDTVKGREAALDWVLVDDRRVFRVILDDVKELLAVPPVPAKLMEKP